MPLLSLREAIATYVKDGASVALEGFTHLIPFAAGHEIIRQQRRGLHLIRLTPDLVYDQMIGMGCAARLTFSWGGNPGVGSLHRLRDAVERGWPQPLDRIAQAMERADTRIPAPREGQPRRATHADKLVVHHVRRHADQVQAAAALADDLVPGGKGNEVSEALERNTRAILDIGCNRFAQ